MKVIFNADDFGVSHGINKGIEIAYLNGILTSTSIRTNGACYSEAAKLLKTKLKGIGVGLHINLTDGKTHTKILSLSDGTYKYSFLSYLINLQKSNERLLQNIEEEINQQFLIAKSSGITIDHVDSEEHVHMIPPIFKIVCKLCKRYGIQSIRLCLEPLYFVSSRHLVNQIKNLSPIKWGLLKSFATIDNHLLQKEKLFTTHAYYGILYTNHMDDKSILTALHNAQRHKLDIIEIASHPALPTLNTFPHTSKKFEKYASLNNRKVELEALKSSELKKYIEDNDIELVTFSKTT